MPWSLEDQSDCCGFEEWVYWHYIAVAQKKELPWSLENQLNCCDLDEWVCWHHIAVAQNDKFLC